MAKEQQTKVGERWLPIRFVFRESGSSVLWLDFGDKALSDPFYNPQIKRLQRRRHRMRRTSIAQFLDIARLVPPATPNGYICHVSRCGSTLLANAMKVAGRSTVFSEAHPLFQLLNRDSFPGAGLDHEALPDVRRRLLDSFLGLYAASFAAPIVIKGHTIDILQIDKLRFLWPELPIVVSIRSPAEVIVSNLEKPGDWIKSILMPLGHKTLFGVSEPSYRQMSVEEFAVQGLAGLYASASRHIDDRMWVLDYSALSADTAASVGRQFDLAPLAPDDAELVRVFSEYSKNPKKSFEPDHERKHRDLTPTARELINRTALPAYLQLLRGPNQLPFVS